MTGIMTAFSLLFGSGGGAALLYYFASPSTQYTAYMAINYAVSWAVLLFEFFSSSSIAVMVAAAPIGFLIKRFIYGWLPLVYATLFLMFAFFCAHSIGTPYVEHYRYHERASTKYSKDYVVHFCKHTPLTRRLSEACDEIEDILSQSPAYLAFKDVQADLKLQMKLLVLLVFESWLLWIAIFISGAFFAYMGFRRLNQRKQRKRNEASISNTAAQKQTFGSVLRSIGNQQSQGGEEEDHANDENDSDSGVGS